MMAERTELMAMRAAAIIEDRKEARRCQANVDEGNCPACGDPDDGHAHPILTVDRDILVRHGNGDHSLCAYSI